MTLRRPSFILLISLIFLGLPWAAGRALAADEAAAPGDFHALFEARCMGCHGHAGDFARQSLVLTDGVLRGRESGREIAPFLRRHKGGLDAEQTARFVAIFTKQVESGGLFQERCGMCHASARGVVRNYLILRDGELVGRYSGRDIRRFLTEHGRSSDEEAAEFYDTLLAIAQGGR